MTIQNLDLYVSRLWDWGFLDECWGGTRIRVSDLDGIVERNGKFLVIEAKGPVAELKSGQRIMFERMVQTGFFTVLIVWGNVNAPQRIRLMTGHGIQNFDYADQALLKNIAYQWFRKVDAPLEQTGEMSIMGQGQKTSAYDKET